MKKEAESQWWGEVNMFTREEREEQNDLHGEPTHTDITDTPHIETQLHTVKNDPHCEVNNKFYSNQSTSNKQ